MKITFFGACGQVTGSKYLVETNGLRVLLDCGMFQGGHLKPESDNSKLPFDAAGVTHVLLSHAHADHSGSLPLLCQQGFSGKIYATPATCEITEYILRDSARIQAQECDYRTRHHEGDQPLLCPVYTEAEAEVAITKLTPVPYFLHTNEWTDLGNNVKCKFLDAGHILGSSIIVIESLEDGKVKRLAFSGDLGKEQPILRKHEELNFEVDGLILETTYGGRKHGDVEEAEKEIIEIVNTAVRHRSKIIVPAFALGRTQELIYILHKLTDQKKIPKIPIYIDSPMAVDVSAVFEKYQNEFDLSVLTDFDKKDNPWHFPNLTYVESVDESKALNFLKGPFMIISASGMCEGGRILHHLKNNMSDPNNTIIFTGYQAEHTLGRHILNGDKHLKIMNEPHELRAKVVSVSQFSAHADTDGLLEFCLHAKKINNLFLVHGEDDMREAFDNRVKEALPGVEVKLPAQGDSFEI